MLRPLLAAALVLAAATTGVGAGVAAGAPAPAAAQAPAAPQESAPLRLEVLSGRADLVSAGDALVEVVLPAGASARGLQVLAGERDVTAAFSERDGRLLGLVSGLPEGPSTLTARLADGRGARLDVVNHPKGGPVFSGPQVQPWFCSTERSGLGAPLDEQCNAPTSVSYVYKSSNSARSGFQPYDPQSPPSDVATTTTDEGKQVPYIVRNERGTLNRSVYDIALLWDPAKPSAEQDAWNRKLGFTFGGGCAPNHHQTNNSGAVLSDLYLKRGFAVATSGLNVLGNNCNPVVSAETMTMVKERLVERYGEIRYTIGTGCSGGSIQQLVIATAYPGLLDGIQPSCTYPDSVTTGIEVLDCSILLAYMDTSALFPPGSPQRAAVMGQESEGPCRSWREVFGFDRAVADPTIGCDGLVLGPAQPGYRRPGYVYHPTDNPTGARCTIQDYAKAVVGTTPDGKGAPLFDNAGVQYGLKALQSRAITPAQFLDLNARIGGYDIDMRRQADRSQGSPEAIRTVYRSGLVNDGQQLANVPIIDLRGHDNAEIHTDYNSYVLRERLERANGTSANHVIFTADTPLVVPPSVTEEALVLMDQWLAAIEADRTADPLSEKVLRNRPATAVDSCYIGGNKITDQDRCRVAFPYYSAPRIAAGGPFTNDNLKCELRPIDPAEYGGRLSAADLERLAAVFPDGVCDFDRPGVEQQDAAGTWYTFAGGPGGRPLGPEPVSSAVTPSGRAGDGRPVAQARSVDDACPAGRVPADSRADDDGNAHEASIDCLVWYEIAKGTSDTTFDPRVAVTREQMAGFLARLIEVSGGRLPADAPDAFHDDDESVHEDTINKLAAAGVLAGKGDGRFDPTGEVSRAQLATFLVKAYDHRSAEVLADRGDYFADDDGHALEGFINRSAAAGFTSGRDGGYAPNASVQRDAMASFLARVLDLLVEEGTAKTKQ
jgi:hypothetical protein